MLLQTVWPFNYGHTLVNTAGWLYEQLVATQTGLHAATPDAACCPAAGHCMEEGRVWHCA